MRERIHGVGSLMVGILLVGSASFASVRPNVLFISIDDLRPELGCYGEEQIISPAIDRLAESGTVFEQAYCQVPVCGASRASLMTGLYPTAQRFVTYYSKAQTDAAGIPDLPAWFRSKGYTTISNGKIYHDRNDNAESWDDVFRAKDYKIYHKPENLALPESEQPPFEDADVGDMDYAGGPVLEKTISDLRKAKASNKPFFMAVGFTKPHLPFNAPKKYWDLYDREKIQLAENPFAPEGAPEEAIHQWNELRNMYGGIPQEGPVSDELARSLIHGYHACVSYSDAMVGQILAELDRLELRGNTIIVLWGDHGWQLGEHSLWCKHALFKTSLNAPLIISAPGHKPGQRSAAQVEFVDIYPTLCELAGLELPPHLQGKSLTPVLNKPGKPFKEAVFSRYHGGEAVKMRHFLYAEWTGGARMLYDHSKDPNENVNVADHPEYAEVVDMMAQRLEKHREQLLALEPAILSAAGINAGANAPPVWKERTFQQKAAGVGQAYKAHINWRVNDADEDELVYAKVSGPEWLTVTQTKNGRIEGVPSAADIGENVFIISVSDGVNPPVQARMELAVVPAPQP